MISPEKNREPELAHLYQLVRYKRLRLCAAASFAGNSNIVWQIATAHVLRSHCHTRFFFFSSSCLYTVPILCAPPRASPSSSYTLVLMPISACAVPLALESKPRAHGEPIPLFLVAYFRLSVSKSQTIVAVDSVVADRYVHVTE